MGKVKIKKKSTLIDMTAMSDVTVLLLTFFMLTSTFLAKEPVTVITPASVSEIKVPVSNVTSVLVSPEGKVFLSVLGEADLQTFDESWSSENVRKDRFIVRASYTVEAREFSIRITVHNAPPESYDMVYQKDATIEEEHVVGGIRHYIVGNNETTSAMWINGCVEGHIQGALTLAELRQMLDSIYKE